MFLLTYVAKRIRFPIRGCGRREEEGVAPVLAGELVRAVHTVVASDAEGSIVGAAEDRGLLLATNVTLYLHLLGSEAVWWNDLSELA